MHLSSAFHLHHPPFSLLHSSKTLIFLSKLSQTQNPHPIFAPFSTSPNWIECWGKTGFRPVTKCPQSAVDYKAGYSSDEDEVGTSRSTGTSTMAKIVEKLKKFGYNDESQVPKSFPLPEKGSVEDIFYSEDGILPNTRGGLDLDLKEVVKFPWERRLDENSKDDEEESKKTSKTALAELTLPPDELSRLRHMAIRLKSRTKISASGVTKQIVDTIHEKWTTEEVVRLKCEGPPALNMKRMHEILERKTGGLVIWRSGTSISLYRGIHYKNPYQKSLPNKKTTLNPQTLNLIPPQIVKTQINNETQNDMIQINETEPKESYEDEIDKLLDELGPRYTDWPGAHPLPVDADLLPGSVPGYQPPLRLLPYGVKPFLGIKESTALKHLAKTLPPHFALGRSRQHQGLAVAMLKLWEKSCIAKIALKRGVQLTTSERMAEDIKKLTGGLMLSRSKDFIVFYRGKNFLSAELTQALLERERLAKSLQDEEEQARLRACSYINSGTDTSIGTDFGTSSGTGTLEETLTLEADSRYGNKIDEDKIKKEVEVAGHMQLVKKLEMKLSLAEKKIKAAERALGKVEENLKPTAMREAQEITDEQRYMFRKLGLRMKAFLLLGRRGVFDGTVENMHLHWKYRELVKILIKSSSLKEVRQIALSLEAESGGILVSVDKVSKGFAIIVYRGNEYHRPAQIRPTNLLSKRKALARSIELQRHEALNKHIAKLSNRVRQLKYELVRMEKVKDRGDDLYAKLDSAYSSEDEEVVEDDMENDYINGVNKSEDGDIENGLHNMHDDDDHEDVDYANDSYNESDDDNNNLHEEHNSVSEGTEYSKCL